MTTVLDPITLTADPEMIRAYAELTDDFNPIHLDPEFAAKTAMGGCIAHGTMSICLLWESLFRTFGDDAGGRLELDVRFVKPVRVGETIRTGGELRDAEPGCYTVWVRGADGSDRVTGTVRLLPAKEGL
jgi:3-hydroxybutyryl-CoA dehydratase